MYSRSMNDVQTTYAPLDRPVFRRFGFLAFAGLNRVRTQRIASHIFTVTGAVDLLWNKYSAHAPTGWAARLQRHRQKARKPLAGCAACSSSMSNRAIRASADVLPKVDPTRQNKTSLLSVHSHRANKFLEFCVRPAHCSPMRLTGKTAIVTGAGSGFGAGIAARFRDAGATVLVADINGDAANDIARAIGGQPWVVDVTDSTSVRRIAGKMPNPDIIVNNAGVTHLPQAMEDVSDEDFDRVYRVNMKSVFLMARHFVPR